MSHTDYVVSKLMFEGPESLTPCELAFCGLGPSPLEGATVDEAMLVFEARIAALESNGNIRQAEAAALQLVKQLREKNHPSQE
jgi:hypothetical protein